MNGANGDRRLAQWVESTLGSAWCEQAFRSVEYQVVLSLGVSLWGEDHMREHCGGVYSSPDPQIRSLTIKWLTAGRRPRWSRVATPSGTYQELVSLFGLVFTKVWKSNG
jgi:hypothetical protein